MTVVHRKFRELFSDTDRFTSSTRGRLERSVGRALFGYRGGLSSIRSAVRSATQELRVHGVADAEIVSILAEIVEDAGRACRADRSSLMSGEPTWMRLRATVVRTAQEALMPPLEEISHVES